MIGAGNVATHLSQAWHQVGYRIAAVYSRQCEKAQRLAQRFGAVSCGNLADLPQSNFYVLAVADDAISRVAQDLSAFSPRGMVLHTAGSVPLSALYPCGENVGVCYPLQTFTKELSLDLRNVPFLIEGKNTQLTEAITELAGSISDKVCFMDSDQRKKVHLSAVFASNFVNHLYDLAQKWLCDQGIEPQLLQALLEEVWRKQQLLGAHAAQTGPARRGDMQVIQEHLELLRGKTPYYEVYQLLSESIYKAFYHDTLRFKKNTCVGL